MSASSECVMLRSSRRPVHVRHVLRLIAWVLLPVTVLVLVYRCDPTTSGLYPPCPFHALTGLYCPGCGSLRALHQLLHGNLGLAFGLNALMVLSAPFLVYAFLSQGLDALGRRVLPRPFLPSWTIWSLLGVILAYWVLRNVPVYPFSVLAP